ncbi:MASE3 domain-containing protein [Giesbergeria anulus]|uniref:PAS domain S-box-containing protein/HDIG domain-containing protein n=1 Tax=Giesbergeria anulus TaxID=180197 RepID=A0A1H9R8M5_9BURK|nr:MASE3 domain-containing protein [Giesbergeria anulus]SER69104.1 PAS domain S-box-containing protein/HDIG domain-containing protein [Giesbergeria anulus]
MTYPDAPDSSALLRTATRWERLVQSLLVPSLMALICWLAAEVNYLLFHALAELFSIVISAVAMVVATTSLRFTRNHFAVYVAVAIGWCGTVDLAHLVAFKGMQLLPTTSANPATQLWLAARGLQALALLSAPLLLMRRVHVVWLHLGFGGAALLSILAVATGHFPHAYTDGQGLTPFKIYTEYAIITAMAVAMGLFWHVRARMSQPLLINLLLAVALMMAAEFAFTRYVSVYAPSNLIGHVLKIFAYWHVYLALVHSTLREPFSMLARTASTYDAVPDPTLVIDRHGLILQANHAAATHCQQAAEALIDQSSHRLFHDASVATQDCPVCQHLGGKQSAFGVQLHRQQGQRILECSLTPLEIPGHGWGYVQVVRDITEHQRMLMERETLVFNLGERVKELRCLHAIAQLVETPGLQLPQLLEGVTRLLPAAFLQPTQVQVALTSTWGQFGSPLPQPLPTQPQERILCIHGQVQGQLQVWYPTPPDGTPPPRFLPEEGPLLDSVVQQVADCIERIQAADKVQRLSHLYEILSTTNRAVVHAQSRDDLLERLYQGLITHGTFPMLFLALCTPHEKHHHLQLDRTHGIAPELIPSLIDTITQADSAFRNTLPNLVDGEVQVYDVPEGQPLPTDPWLDFLRQQGIEQRALLPLFSDGQLFGVFGLYANSQNTFEDDERLLLNEMASDLSFALHNLSNAQRLRAAQEQASLSEHRFSELFEASPLPMQIYSVNTGELHTLNKAFQQWLGYNPQDIATVAAWFECAYPDPQTRQELRLGWEQSLQQARTGTVVESPELALCCKDGSRRIARGTMALVGEEAIVAWTDLTDIRRSQSTLLESETRFRNMIEQTISGVYVRRGGDIIYVNPSYCQMIGWSAPELLHKNILSFTTTDPDNLQRIHAAWARLAAGERNISYSVPMRHKNGQLIDLELNANQLTWDDGKEATIVMAQDVTERKRAEEQIAGYVRQLEDSMKGTLQAVSNMVEMRDPYTAGHERRVGLIAGAIARELGWDEGRCAMLELVGLVHDIGKIAVPAEILTKPSRLSELEMEIIKCHAQTGYEILKDVHFPMPVAEIIRQHHERMDGSGYPQGLRGNDIMPEARVLCVADVLESMAADRPYRPALGLDVALAEIVRGRGTVYDAQVADALVRLVRERGYTLPD